MPCRKCGKQIIFFSLLQHEKDCGKVVDVKSKLIEKSDGNTLVHLTLNRPRGIYFISH